MSVMIFNYGSGGGGGIPDGDVVTPINDVTTWLKCAGINPLAEGNPTLAQVVASASLCATLMASANAVNYMIRSTTIQAAVIGSSTALAALDASSPFVSVQMTGNSAPTGYVATHSNSAYQANAYNLTNPSGPYSAVVLGGSVGIHVVIDIPHEVWPYKFNLSWYSNYNESYVACSMKIQGSEDGGTTWVDLTASVQLTGLNTVVSVLNAVPSDAVYSKYRAIVTAITGGTMGAWGFKVFGKAREVA